MKKNKIIKILGIFIAATLSLSLPNTNVFANGIENCNEETVKKTIGNFNLQRILKKDDSKFLIYKHKSSGQLALISCPKNGEVGDFSKTGIFFSFIPKDNMGIAHGIDHFIGTPIRDNLLKNNTETNMLVQIGFGPITETPHLGLGFKININKWSEEIIDIIIKELKDPQFLKDNGKIFEAEKKRMILELKEKEETEKIFRTEQSKYQTQRFIGGKFKNGGIPEEIEKLKLEDVKKVYKKIVCDPSKSLIVISANKNKNYAEILKMLDEKYLSNLEKKDNFEKIKIEDYIETQPIRNIEVNNIKYVNYFKNENDSEREFNFKHKATLYFKIPNLTPQEKDVFNISINTFNNLFEDKIKELGYKIVEVNSTRNIEKIGDFNPVMFDDMFFLELYGNDSSKFKKEVLEENAKKLLKELYNKIKNMSEKELLSKCLEDNYRTHYVLNLYRNNEIDEQVFKSFALTKDPFNEKFFDIKNNEIQDDGNKKRVLKNIKENLDKFKIVIEKPPTYIELFKATGKKPKEEKINFKTYKTPIEINTKNEKIKEILTEHIHEKFLEPNIVNKGLIYQSYLLDNLYISDKDVKKIENYIFKKFKKSIRNYKINNKELEKIKEKYRNSIENSILFDKEYEKDKEKILKDNKFLKDVANVSRHNTKHRYEIFKNDVENLKKNINKTTNKKKKEDLKKYLKSSLKNMETLKEEKDKTLNYFVEKSKKNYYEIINSTKENIKKSKENLKEIENISLKDINKAIKDIKVNGNKLEKIEKIKVNSKS